MVQCKHMTICLASALGVAPRLNIDARVTKTHQQCSLWMTLSVRSQLLANCQITASFEHIKSLIEIIMAEQGVKIKSSKDQFIIVN